MIENEDDDPVGEPPARDPEAAFRAVAERVGLIGPGDPMDRKLLDFANGVVDLCATIAEPYGDSEAGGNAAEHIRAELYD